MVRSVYTSMGEKTTKTSMGEKTTKTEASARSSGKNAENGDKFAPAIKMFPDESGDDTPIGPLRHVDVAGKPGVPRHAVVFPADSTGEH